MNNRYEEMFYSILFIMWAFTITLIWNLYLTIRGITMEDSNSFKKLSAIDITSYIEKKGKFSYLSWTHAVTILRENYPKSVWEVKRYDWAPFLRTECGYFVEVALTVDGITLSQIHPVLDNRNNPIYKPTSFDINNSIQRCLVKAIALHGLGISVYSEEDLPKTSFENKTNNNSERTYSSDYSKNKTTNNKITDKQISYLKKLVQNNDNALEEIKKVFGVDSTQIRNISKSDATKIIEHIVSKNNSK